MVKRLANNEFQKALYTLLSGAGLTIFDVVPKTASLPYLIIGEDLEKLDNQNKDNDYKIIETSIEIFTDKKGFKKGKEIQEQVIQLLDSQPLILSNFSIEKIEETTYSNRNSKEFLLNGIDLEITLKQIS
ncbi:MAG: hypothetical protein COB02_11790 [Candidatus Cloacimonadota bacterium]|nr:MAG: hypothetical protein COB02_11790 [Candidatus Cloacimonadota bacterium]